MPDTITSKLNRFQGLVLNWRTRAVLYRDSSAAGTLSANDACDMLSQLAAAVNIMEKIPRTAAIGTKAVEEWEYQGGTIAADFAAIESGLHAVGDWIAAKDNVLWNGFSITATHPWTCVVPPFTSQATAVLRTELDALIAAIDVFTGNISTP